MTALPENFGLYFVCECGRMGCWEQVPDDEYLILQNSGLWPTCLIVKKEHRLAGEDIVKETENLCMIRREQT